MTRALVLTGGVGHDFEGTTAALRALVAADGISTEVSDDPVDAFDALADDHWDLFVVNALRWRMLAERYAELRDAWAITTPPRAEAALAGHLAGGGGVLVTHTGLICFDDWPGWAEALGAGWDWEDDHSFHPELAEVDIRMTGGDTMSLEDEVYGFLDWKATVEVLATGHHTGRDHPVIWRLEQGGGRVAVDLLGHHAASYDDPRHAAIVRGLARWAAGLDGAEQLGGAA